jgi:DNA replicative helicase MCM subunit Mcm2 (Cdc46/Mcm family)
MRDVSDDHDNTVMVLEQTEEIKQKQVVTSFLSSFNSKSVIVQLNHQYQNKIIESPVILEDWKLTNERFDDILKGKEVIEEDRVILVRLLNYNANRITDHFSQQTLAHMHAGRRAKMERIEKEKNTPPREVSVAQALMMHEGNVRIKGMFVGGSQKVEKMYIKIGFRCGNCDEPNVLADYSDRPKLTSEIPHMFAPKYLSRQKCKICDCESIGHELYEELVSALRVELRDEVTSNDPPNTDVILFNVLQNDVPWNEPVKIIGSIQRVKVKDRLLPHIFVGLGSDGSTTDNTNPIERIEEIEPIEITPDDEKKIQEFLIQNKGKVFDALAELYAPSHIGDKDAKKVVLMCAANTGLGPSRRINVLFLGETGLAKTALAKDAARLVPGSKFASAMDSTTNSLICVVDGDTGHFRFGPLVTANNAICVVDEIGRMPKEEQARLLSAMGPDGTIYFGRFGINRELPATEGFILTANPDSISGKFRYPDKIDPNEFPFLGPFRDRIDLVVIFRQNRDPTYLRDYGSSKFEDEDSHAAHMRMKKEGENYQFLRKWFLEGRKFVDFKWQPEARMIITEYFTNVMTSEDSQASNRLHDTLRKCCVAIARLKLKDTIDEDDVKEVIELHKNQSKYWSQVEDIPYDPRDLAYQEIVKKLTGQKFGVEFEELLQTVCKDNDYVDQYTKKFDEKTGERVWDVGNNHKVRFIREKFTKAPRDERVLILSLHPLTLAWREKYTGGDKPIDADTIDRDVVDVVDTVDVAGKPNERNSDSSNYNTSTRPKISNEGVNPDVNNVNSVNKSDKQKLTSDLAGKGDEKISGSSSNANTSTKPGIANNGVTSEDHQVPQVTLPSKPSKTDPRSNNIASDNGIHKTVDNEPPEDYETYVARQKKMFGSIEKEEQKSTFRRIFDELKLKNEGRVPGKELREALVSSGVSQSDLDAIIMNMEMDEDGIREVGLEEGPSYPAYRWKSDS